MRVALTSPYAHPEVRRGSERYLHELAAWLAGRAHAVTVVATTPGRSGATQEPTGERVRLVERGRTFGRGKLRVDELLSTVRPVARCVRSLDLDVVQSHHYVDACGVRLSGRRRPPYVLWLPGAPPATALGGRPLHRLAFRVACAGAARIHTLSAYAARSLRDGFGVETHAIPPGVRTQLYAGDKQRGPDPVILCTAATEDARKRVDLLLRAFPVVLRHRPRARLLLAPPRPDHAAGLVAALDAAVRARVDVAPRLDSAELAAAYRDADVAVLPSVEEAFGLVMVESLAAGTPVVGTDHGAIPEVLDDPAVSRLFPGDDIDALARAIVEMIDVARDPSTPARCRASARRWDWEIVGPEVEEALAAVAQ